MLEPRGQLPSREPILVPLDGSALSERALLFAAPLARALDCPVLLLRAVQVRPSPREDASQKQAIGMQEAEAYCDSVVKRLSEGGIRAERHVSYAPPERAVADIAGTREVAMIVMCTHGRDGVGRLVYGSVAEAVLRSSEVPVLLISPRCETWQEPPRWRILVTLDGSPLSEAVLTEAAALVGGLRAEVTVFRVVEDPGKAWLANPYKSGYFPMSTEELHADALRYLEGMAEVFPDAPFGAQAVVGQPATAIAEAARNLGASMIAMATHGRGGLARVVLGSAAMSVLRIASTPLLLVRPRT